MSQREKDGPQAEFVSLDSDHPFAKAFRAGLFKLERGGDIPNTTSRIQRQLLDPELRDLLSASLQRAFESEYFREYAARKDKVGIFRSKDPLELVWERLPASVEWILGRLPLSDLLTPKTISKDKSELQAVFQSAIRRIPSEDEIKIQMGYDPDLLEAPPTGLVEHGPEWCRLCMATQIVADFMFHRPGVFATAMASAVKAAQKRQAELAAAPPPQDAAPKDASFDPRKFGGKELCLAVSYLESEFKDLDKLAKAMTHKAKIRYDSNSRISYKTPWEWRQEDDAGFSRHLSKLRAKARRNGWYDRIPKDYCFKYLR